MGKAAEQRSAQTPSAPVVAQVSAPVVAQVAAPVAAPVVPEVAAVPPPTRRRRGVRN